MPGPIATLGSMHVCPMLNPGTPPPPHVGGPVSGPGAPTVLATGKAVAVMGDMCVCAGPPDAIVQAEGTVLAEGKPVATQNSLTAHGGMITQGDPTILVGTGPGSKTEIMPIEEIPFVRPNAVLTALATISGRGKLLKKAVAAQDELKKEAEKIHGILGDFSLSL